MNLKFLNNLLLKNNQIGTKIIKINNGFIKKVKIENKQITLNFSGDSFLSNNIFIEKRIVKIKNR